jgi:HrpA-like RNA helicase
LPSSQIHEDEESGGVLVFLPGQDDIEALQQLLLEYLPYCKDQTRITASDGEGRANGPVLSNILSQTVVEDEAVGNDGVRGIVVSLLPSFEVCPLYASMPADEQLRVFSRPQPGVRRFVLSTNIAETSVTVSGE